MQVLTTAYFADRQRRTWDTLGEVQGRGGDLSGARKAMIRQADEMGAHQIVGAAYIRDSKVGYDAVGTAISYARTGIRCLYLPPETRTKVETGGITSIGKLLAKSEAELSEMGFATVHLSNIKKALELFAGLELKAADDPTTAAQAT